MILKKNEHLKTMKGTVVLAKENENAPARTSIQWKNTEIKPLLAELGLPCDASFSVLCVEMMVHLGSFQQSAGTTLAKETKEETDILEGVYAMRGNVASAAIPSKPTPQHLPRPLSDHLDHFRILPHFSTDTCARCMLNGLLSDRRSVSTLALFLIVKSVGKTLFDFWKNLAYSIYCNTCKVRALILG